MSDIIDFIESSNDSSSDDPSFNVNLDDEIDDNQEAEQENPFQCLIRLTNNSSNYNDRKNALKYIQDALRSVNEIEQIREILEITKTLSEDSVTHIQIDCLEKYPQIIDYLVENVSSFDQLIREYLYPTIVHSIGNANNRIRKSSQTCLIRLFELSLVKIDEIEQDLIPSLCQLERSSDDFKNESILLMTRLTSYLPMEIVRDHFLPTIIEQSTSIAFQTRKTCATSLSDLSNLLPSSSIDERIVPCLSNLCSDPFWGVRKSCAEVIHPIGQRCSNESRWNVLSTCLIQLLQDQSRWVKTAALRALGYFISTFCSSTTDDSPSNKQIQVQDENEFNDFLFWKETRYLNCSIDDEHDEQNPSDRIENHYQRSKQYPIDDVRRILPMELLDFYRNLIEQSYSSGVETDIVHQGAFTFPAVAQTIGHRHWSLIRDLHKKFSEDLQWKVRRTLAFSLHCLAEILSEEQVEEDLCPVFDSFIRDVDEVKIGILSNLSKFFKHLRPSTRRVYLDKLESLTTVDNQRNWRFRLETANQLSELTDLFDSEDVFKSISPLLFNLSTDRVSDVRLSSIKALSKCYTKYKHEDRLDLIEVYLDESNRLFRTSNDWKLRQLFVHLIQSIFQLENGKLEETSSNLVDCLVDLSSDPVVNVRLVLAKFLVELSIEDGRCSESILKQMLVTLSQDRDRDVRQTVDLRRAESTH